MSKAIDAEELSFAANASDRQWWNRTGMCGGCGTAECHPNVGCTPGWLEGCRYCPNKTTPEQRLTPPSKEERVELDGQQDILDLVEHGERDR